MPALAIAALTRELRADELPALATHLLALDAEDRRLRFGSPMSDPRIVDYVRHIPLEHDAVFVVTDDELAIVAAAHLARSYEVAEIGLSVLREVRGRGLGSALFERCITRARNWRLRALFSACLAENETMVYLSRKHGLSGHAADGTAAGHLSLPAPTSSSMTEDLVREQLALFDLEHKKLWLALRRRMPDMPPVANDEPN